MTELGLTDPTLLLRGDVLDDPKPLYAKLRREAPVWPLPGHDTFLVSDPKLVGATLEAAESRDRKGIYATARRGELANFTGIDSPYEAPEAPDPHLDAAGGATPEACADLVVDHLQRAGFVSPSTGSEPA